MAELIIYFFEPDPTTARLDDYVLRRQVNDAAPEVLARNLMKQGSTPFFRYFGKRRYTSQVSELDSVPDSDLPLFHSAEIHGSIADTAASARGDSIRAVRVSFRSTKGVISVTGKVAVSVVLRGRVTMAGTDDIILADDIVYATDPGAGLCQDMFGMFSGARVIVADNLMNAPVRPRTNWNHRTYDDTKDEFFHGVILALDIFTVQNYNAGSRNDESCEAKTWGRGCLYITGGIIQKTRGAVGTGAGTGYVEALQLRFMYGDRAPTLLPHHRALRQRPVLSDRSGRVFGEELLEDRPRSDRPRKITPDDEAEIVRKTLEEKPADATHWSCRLTWPRKRASIRPPSRGSGGLMDYSPTASSTSSCPLILTSLKSCATWWVSTSIPRSGPLSSLSTRRARSKPSTAPSQVFPSRRGALEP